MKRLKLLSIWGVIFFSSSPLKAQLEEHLQLNEFPWSGVVSYTNEIVTIRSKPVPGYVILSDHTIHYGKLRIKVTEEFISEVKIKKRRWESFAPSEVIGLGKIASPRQLMLGGRNLAKDTTENFIPVILTRSGSQQNGFLKQKKLVGGGRIFLFAESLDSSVEVIYESEVENITEAGDPEMTRELFDLEANRNIKYGMLVGNSVQVGFDGTHREGLKIKALRRSYESAEHHLYEASRAIYKGNYGYAGFMLGKGAYEYLAPPEEEEVEIPAEVLFGGPAFGPFLLRLFQALDTTDYEQPDQWVLADYLNTYALFLHNKGKHRIAGSLYEYGLSICRHHLPEDAEVALALQHNYALLRFETGYYREADSLLNSVGSRITNFKGADHPVTCVVRNNQAMLSARMGSFKEAEDRLKLLQEKVSEVTPAYSIDDVRLRINLALLAHHNRQYDMAMKTYINALETLKSREKISLPDYNLTLLLLGDLYLDIMKEDPDQAGRLDAFLNAVKATIEDEYSKNHSAYADILQLEGRYNLLMGSYKEALDDFKLANEIYRDTKGRKSYDYLSTSRMMALCLWKTGDLDKAEEHLRTLATNYLDLKSELFSTMSEVQREAFWRQIKPHVDLYSYFALENAERYPEWLAPALNFRIQTKGLLFSSSTQLRKAINESNDPELQRLFNEWVILREELLIQYNLDNADRDKNSLSETEIKDELEKVERALANFITVPDTITFSGLKNRLSPGEAIIEFVKIDKHIDYLDTARYYAFIINSESETPKVVGLNKGDLLEDQFYSQYINSINYQLEDLRSYDKYWSPLANYLTGIEKVYVVNDGIYNLINVEGLKNGEGKYLAENFEIIYLTDLNQPKAGAKRSSFKEATLMGAPHFNHEGIPLLPGALMEVDALGKMLETKGFSTSIYTDRSATEKKLRETSGKQGILHLATHGYFLEDTNTGGPLHTLAERPDLQSGLILAEAKSERPVFQDLHDGFFSAYEALSLNLRDIELVVLSACETGKGSLVAGESVQGLARAFKIAGADYVIMSLWKVDDEATQKLMNAFYQLWTENNDFHEAFRTAKNTLREEYPHPYYWSGFVLLE